MRARSTSSQPQREQLVELFNAGLAPRAATNWLGVSHGAGWMLSELSGVETPKDIEHWQELLNRDVVINYLPDVHGSTSRTSGSRSESPRAAQTGERLHSQSYRGCNLFR